MVLLFLLISEAPGPEIQILREISSPEPPQNHSGTVSAKTHSEEISGKFPEGGGVLGRYGKCTESRQHRVSVCIGLQARCAVVCDVGERNEVAVGRIQCAGSCQHRMSICDSGAI